MLDARGLELIISDDVKICTKNLDKITDKDLAKATLDTISHDYSKLIER